MTERPFNINPDVLCVAGDVYRREVVATAMTDSTKGTYLLHVEQFVRWVEGDFNPGKRLREHARSATIAL